MKKLLILALVVLMLVMIGSASAITWGTLDGEGHPMVVGLLFQQPDGLYSCTGTLLTPYVVLTAGHCTESAGVVNLNTWVRNAPDLDAVYAAERPLFPPGPAGREQYLNTLWVPGQAVPHPDFADFAGFPNTRDVGVVLLSRPIYVDQYGQLPTLGQFDYLNRRRGSNSGDRLFTSVGYGRQEFVPLVSEATRNDWNRQYATTTLINTNSAYTDGYNFMFSDNPGRGNGTGGTCYGDSGGPQFFGNTLIVASITSYGVTNYCTGNSYSYRADIAETLDFVNFYLSWTPGS